MANLHTVYQVISPNLAGGLVCTVYGPRTRWQLSSTADVLWSRNKQWAKSWLYTGCTVKLSTWCWNTLVKGTASYSIKQCKQDAHCPSLGPEPRGMSVMASATLDLLLSTRL